MNPDVGRQDQLIRIRRTTGPSGSDRGSKLFKREAETLSLTQVKRGLSNEDFEIEQGCAFVAA